MLDLTPEQRAIEAERVMSNPVVIEAFAGVESSILAGLLACPLSDAAQLQSWASLLQNSKAFKLQFKNMIAAGQIEAQLEEEDKPRPKWFERYTYPRKSA